MNMGMPGGQLTDKDILSDMLITEKYISTTCDHAVTESANPQVLQAMQQIQRSKQEHVHQIFSQMQQRGWYKVKPASPSQ